MRALSLLCLLSLLLAGCEAHQPATDDANPTVPAGGARTAAPLHVAAAAPQVAAQPLVPEYQSSRLGQRLIYGQALVDDGDTSATRLRLVLNGQTWRVHTVAQADSTHPLSFQTAANRAAHMPPEKGIDVKYIFQLLNARGQPRFTRQLRKADFAQEVYGDLRTVSPADLPMFLGYWPARQALVFRVDFGREDTDEGVSVLLLLDAFTGQVLHKAAENIFMGGCDCYPILAPDGQTLLAGEEMLRNNWPAVSLTRKDWAVAGTRILNDSSFLVVYEIANSSSGYLLPNNAEIVDRTGKIKRRFTFHGTDFNMTGGGYNLETEFVPATGTHYLYDGSTHTFTLIPVRQPTALQQLPAARMLPFQPPQKASELKLEFDSDDMPSAALYVDTLTQQLRYVSTEVNYQTSPLRK